MFELFKVLVSYTVIWRYGKVVVQPRPQGFFLKTLVGKSPGDEVGGGALNFRISGFSFLFLRALGNGLP